MGKVKSKNPENRRHSAHHHLALTDRQEAMLRDLVKAEGLSNGSDELPSISRTLRWLIRSKWEELYGEKKK